MGEMRGCRPPERPTYPGLVRPYRDDSDYVNQPKFIVNKMSSKSTTIQGRLEHDPFSIYDDDSAHDHYFFLPAGKLDLTSFKRTPSTLHQLQQQQQQHIDNNTTRTSSRSNCGTWRRGKPGDESQPLNIKKGISQTTNTTSTTTTCQCSSNSSTTNFTRTRLITNKTKRPSSGEYCSLSVDAVAPKYPNSLRSHGGRGPLIQDEESFRKFALKLVNSTTTNSSSDINMNDYHNPSRRKTDDNDYCDGDSSKTKPVKGYKMNKCIDTCTCMICVKAGRYHWSEGDTDSYIEEPCSCIGTRKNVVGRWICMGVVALFLPCLVCYLPAKLCQSTCSSRNCSKTSLTKTPKLKSKQCLVRYVKEPNDEIPENGLL